MENQQVDAKQLLEEHAHHRVTVWFIPYPPRAGQSPWMTQKLFEGLPEAVSEIAAEFGMTHFFDVFIHIPAEGDIQLTQRELASLIDHHETSKSSATAQ